MAQIYEEQVRVNRDPMAPDTGLMDYFEKGRKDAIGTIDHNIKVEFERRETQKQSLKDLTLMQAKQVYQNAATLYNNDTKKYSEVVTKGLETIYKAVPDGPEKINIMAEVSIFGSGYDTKVKRGELDKQENIWKTRQRDLTMQSSDAALQTLGTSMLVPSDVNTGKYTTQEYMNIAQSYKDSELQLKKSYDQRYMVDRNGNPIFSDSERAQLEDRWTNRGYYAVLGYAQNNVQTDYNGVVDTLDWLKANKDIAKQKYGYSDDVYAKTINTMDKIISGQMTPQQELQNTLVQVTDKAQYDALELKVDKTGNVVVKNNKMNNLTDTISVFSQMQANENAYVGPEKEKQYKQLAMVSQAVVDQVETKIGVKGDRWWIQKKLGIGTPNAGEIAITQVNNNLDTVISTMGITNKDDVNVLKATMYRDTMNELKAGGVDLTGKQDPEISRKVANNVYKKYVESVVGKVPYKEGEDPKLALNNALLQYKHNQSVNTVQNEITNLYGN